MASTEDILKKYGAKIESKMDSPKTYSKEYTQFKQDMLPELSRYKRWTKTLGNIVNIKVSEKDRARMQKYLDIAHLDVTPSQALTLAIFSLLVVFSGIILLVMAIFFITGEFQILLLFLGLIASIFVFYYTYTMPQRLASSWRLKASSQMVPAVLYVVVYMKHTSNLERAIEFASQHLEIPLALDFRKVIYDVEIGKFSSIKQSLDAYLENWRDYASEFVESFHLIESSLFEPSETRRVQILEKALQVILDGVYEKMLRYSRQIRSPLTNVYMLGIILPTLGLALLPLASALLQGAIQWQHVFILFNVIIPFFVFYLTSEILLKRPGGHGESSVLELNPNYEQYASKKPWVKSFIISFPLLIVGLLPFIFQIDFLTSALGLKSDYTFSELGIPFLEGMKLFDFKEVSGHLTGPFGIGAILLSFLVPISIALFFSIAYNKKTIQLIKSREDTIALEAEFTNSLFQLGNRLGDGTPAEIAFAKVAESTQGQRTQSFFALVNQNIQQLGMSVEQAIFNPKRGAIIYYPSSLISTSMRILVESVKKGLQVAARSLMSISEYVKNIQRINERLRDLLAEIVSDMKSNMTFLAPLLAGIVVGLSAMIALILNKLAELTALTGTEGLDTGFTFSAITDIFDITTIIPPYFIQISIGLYIVEIILILTSALVTVDSGKDPLKTKYESSKNLTRGMLLYVITAFLSTMALSILAAIALSGLAT
ncbi:hypothetical protein AUJ84_00945 [Candidatus Pacearchaeota archaeon CG1_02_32_132]|nr:MAG: hypothetical protein AUJ84_00945 [Candidatus Pacearchaeota archaeon CG1_02_32_132]